MAILRPRSEVSQADEEVRLAQRRAVMVERDLRRRGIRDDRVLNAMLSVPRHRFVTPNLAAEAYADTPLPTRLGQTISQPYIVALMTQAVGVTNSARVLEIGTGSGYQAAILAALGADVWSVEASPELHGEAVARLRDLGFSAVHLRCGDGTLGWPDAAPFDGILATGSLPERPTALLRQLRPGGVFVGPIGPLGRQRLVRLEVDPPREREETLCVCSFVPLVGAAGWRSRTDQEG
ncbi:MAG: protein-L-isoaspartate(D-aspartate) O-methyltransferase [Candidatus Bipolaricaulota bacterium]|nr:protein-L-isoaspartate(D-aspartate) O-methyltransferase [Candidatus Bipolaricaulota bacterium]